MEANSMASGNPSKKRNGGRLGSQLLEDQSKRYKAGANDNLINNPKQCAAAPNKMQKGLSKIGKIGSADEENTESEKKFEPDEEDQSEGAGGVVNELLRRDKEGQERVQPSSEAVDSGSESSELEELSDSDDEDAFLSSIIPDYRVKKQCVDKHFEKISTISDTQLVKEVKNVIPELRQIIKKEIPSKRLDILKKYDSIYPLIPMGIGKGFTKNQNHRVYQLLTKKMMKCNSGRFECLCLLNVLLPEALIRIFARVNGIGLKSAEKELQFGASYGGPIPDDVQEAEQ
ncbi:unnamed protein product [Orchesella dallaii]|uniref:Uncharacterized protein n=1 Tax=Orchesella dallaii TaxID=48710 RepID=A0ABP1RSB1_9HEXA